MKTQKTIEDYLNDWKDARYGEDVRQGMIDCIRQCYNDATGNPESLAGMVQTNTTLTNRVDSLIAATNAGSREDTLWSGDATYEGVVMQLTHPADDYDYLDIKYVYVGGETIIRVNPRNRNNVLRGINTPDTVDASPNLKIGEMDIAISADYQSVTISKASALNINVNGVQPLVRYTTAAEAQAGYYGAGHICKIVGVKIKAPDSAELLDLRNRYDGDVANTAGEAIRGAFTQIAGQVSGQAQDLASMSSQLMVQNQTINGLSGRITTVEQDITAADGRIDAIEDRLDGHDQDIADLKDRMRVRTDNLIDVSDPDFWLAGSYLESDAQALYVHSALITVAPGTTLYLGGADTTEKIRSITVFDIESGEIVETKTKMISGEWSHNTITAAGSQIVVNIGMITGEGGLTPAKLAEIAPRLYVSPTLYTADTYEPYDKSVALSDVLTIAKHADAGVAVAQTQMTALQAQMQQTRQIVQDCLYVRTDNLIDVSDPDFWLAGSYLESDTQVLYVHTAPIVVEPGTTLYLGGADESTNIRSIAVFDAESDPLESKMKMISTDWSNSQITVQGSQIVVNVGIKSGVGGITPTKMAEIAPRLYVSPTLYTADTYMAHDEVVDMGQLLTASRTATAQVNAMQTQVSAATEQASGAAMQASNAAAQAAQAAQAANAATAQINVTVTWQDILKRTPLQCKVATTEAKCIAVSGNALFVNGALKLEKYNILYGGSGLELTKTAWPLSGRNMRCYQMATHSSGDYIFTANRLRTPGYTGEAVAGYLQVIDTANCQVRLEEVYDAKATGLEYYSDRQLLAVNLQVGGWVLYDVSDPLDPVEVYRHTETRGQEANEWQKGEFVETADHLYYVVCGFSDGIRLYEIDKNNYSNVTLIQLFRPRAWNNDLADAHVFDVTVKYPYAYCTIAPLTYAVNQDGAPYGALTIDLRQLDNPIYHFEPIPVDDINTYLASDAQPSEIIRIDDRLIVNNGNKGVGIFDIDPDNPLHTIWRGNIPCGGDEVHSLEQDPDRGLLFVGCAFGDAPYNLRVFRGV